MRNVIQSVCFLLMFCSLKLTAQDPSAVISEAKIFSLKPVSDFYSFSNDWNDFMVFRHAEKDVATSYSLVMTGRNDEIALASNIRVATQVEDNHFSLAGLALAGRNLTAFVQSHNLVTGRSLMSMQALDNKGGLSSEGMLVGYFDVKDAANAGSWKIASSPDQKHIGLIAQLPYVPGEPERFNYYFINEHLTITHKGEFSIENAGLHTLQIRDFLCTDQGGFYLTGASLPGNEGYPLVYKAGVGSDSCKVIPVHRKVLGYESGSYQAKLNPQGELVLAGYFQNKGVVEVKKVQTAGIWSFNSSKPKEVNFQPFDLLAERLDVRHLLINGATYFLVGESKSEILVSALGADGTRKFDLSLNRALNATSSEALPSIVAGILQGKLFLVYGNGKALVALSIDDNGVRKEEKVLEELKAEDKLLPQFFSGNSDHFRILSASADEIQVITLR